MVDSKGITQLLLAALISGTVVSAVMGIMFKSYLTKVEQEIKSRRTWKEESVAELLGPVNMQLDRTNRAFGRWREKSVYLEAKIIKQGNETILDLLLTKGYLIPPELLQDAGQLIEHYDVWLEEFDRQRVATNPDLETPFVFAGPLGYPFPRESADRFQAKFAEYWAELYGSQR